MSSEKSGRLRKELQGILKRYDIWFEAVNEVTFSFMGHY
jgi:hypothetical protein